MKTCPKCGEEKLFGEFHKDRSKKDGCQVYCKKCIQARDLLKHQAGCECLGCRERFTNATGLKQCPKCSETKPVDAFYKKASGRCQSYCMKCNAETSNVHRKKRVSQMTDEERGQWNLARRLSKYNITEVALRGLLDAQHGECICGQPLDLTALHIDHDHACCPTEGSCGRCIRGVLCSNCNTALGLIHDDPNRALSLATYLIGFQDVLNLTSDKGARPWV